MAILSSDAALFIRRLSQNAPLAFQAADAKTINSNNINS
jgi:hypothetical protein